MTRRAREFLTPVALVLNAPELLQSPLNWLDAQVEINGGKIQVKRFAAESAAFAADTQGEIPIADNFPDSRLADFPIRFSLAQPLAHKIRLASAEASADARYIKLPDFLRAGGTLNRPKAKIDKAALAGTLLDAISRIPGVNEKTGGLLQGVGALLSGQQPGESGKNSNANSSPPPATPPPAFNPLDLLKKPKKK